MLCLSIIFFDSPVSFFDIFSNGVHCSYYTIFWKGQLVSSVDKLMSCMLVL